MALSLTRWAVLTTLFGAMSAGTSVAQHAITQPVSVRPTALSYYDSYYAQGDDEDDEVASPSDMPAAAVPDAAPAAVPAPVIASYGDCNACGDCGSVQCGGDCGGDGCNLGDPWTLMGHLHGDCEPAVKVGGWTQWGYYNKTNGLFNQHPNKLNNAQSWIYAEKETDTSDGGWDWGFRADLMYGTDAKFTQAFGNQPGTWDYLNGYDHGIYGWALPQVYGDIAYGDLKVRLGRFYTTVGYEVVPATGNFFYSHAMTMFLTEPFTHTGVLASYDVKDDVTLYGGWTLGWDSGYGQIDQGSSFLGGFAIPLVGDTKFTYMTTAGNLGFRGRDAYTHSLLFDVPITDRLTYVAQSDFLRVNSLQEDNIGINQYLFWTYSDCLKFGSRVEWWKGDSGKGLTFDQIRNAIPFGTHSIYAVTFGANVIPQANVTFRPEIRYNWAPFADYSQWIFSIDMVTTF